MTKIPTDQKLLDAMNYIVDQHQAIKDDPEFYGDADEMCGALDLVEAWRSEQQKAINDATKVVV